MENHLQVELTLSEGRVSMAEVRETENSLRTMVRLRFSRSSPAPEDQRGVPSLINNAPVATTMPLQGNVPNNNQENVQRQGNNNNNRTTRQRGGGGVGDIQNSRVGRPASAGREARKRAKKVLALLDSPRKAIMSRTRGGRNGRGDPPQQHQQARSASVPRNMGRTGENGNYHNPSHGQLGIASSSTPGQNQPALHSSAQDTGIPSRIQITPNVIGSLNVCSSSSLAIGMKPSDKERVPSESSFGSLPGQQESAISLDKGDQDLQKRLKDYDSLNVLCWLLDEAPSDIIPRVLSYAGSRKIDVLSRTNKAWRATTLSDAVWRTACEDTGKWTPEDQDNSAQAVPEPGSWLQYYRDNPLVPVDYDSIERAFRVGAFDGSLGRRRDVNEMDANNVRPMVPEHRRSIRVLLRPGKYVLQESLTVHAIGDSKVTIETVKATTVSVCKRCSFDHLYFSAVDTSSNIYKYIPTDPRKCVLV